jgi:hypothetical protein
MIYNVILAILIFLFSGLSLFAQEAHQSGDKHTEDQHAEDHHRFKHHRIVLFTGYALTGGAIDAGRDG